jgi:subtilase-type serine protease
MVFGDRSYIEGALSYGVNDYSNDRRVEIGGIRRNADSDHDGNVWFAALGGGYTVPWNTWMLQFFGSLEYGRLDEESFEESGAGAISLRTDDRQTEYLVSELGLCLSRAFSTQNGIVIPEISVGWKYDYDIDDQIVTTSFVGSPGAAFSIEGQDIDRNAVIFCAGLTFQNKGGFGTSIRYNGELRDDYSAHGIIGEIMYRF